MRLVVDPRLLVEVLEQHSARAVRAMQLLVGHTSDDLQITPLTYLSLSPLFGGEKAKRDDFFDGWRISVVTDIPVNVMHDAYRAWRKYQSAQPDAHGSKRMFDALYAGAFSVDRDGLLTLQPDLFETYLKGVKTVGQ